MRCLRRSPPTSGPFTDIQNLCRLARHRVDGGADYLERYYLDTYNKGTWHGAFEDRSAAAWHLEMLEGMWHRRKILLAESRSLDRLGVKGKHARLQREAIYDQVNAINRVFGLPLEYHDALAARWDALIAQGKTPDFRSR